MTATEPTTDQTMPSSARTLLQRSHAGDQGALPELRKVLENPALVEVLGNLSRRIEDVLIDNVAGKDLTLREGLTRKLAMLREELADPNATSLERQLVERVVLCWLTCHEAEYRLAQQRDLPIKQADFWQRRIDHAHRRYLSAVKMLATVRRLAIPVLIGHVNLIAASERTTRQSLSPQVSGKGASLPQVSEPGGVRND